MLEQSKILAQVPGVKQATIPGVARPPSIATARLGVIGPNSVIQLGNACRELLGGNNTDHFFTMAGYADLLHHSPTRMIDEAIPRDLFKYLYQAYPHRQARRIALRAGELTAEYIIANRIPGMIIKLLQVLPPAISGPMLLKAIKKNAWTFTGSGTFEYQLSPVNSIRITNNPLHMPDCAWHIAVLQNLFTNLVCRESKVRYLQPRNNQPVDDFLISYGLSFSAADCCRDRRAKVRQLCLYCTARQAPEKTLH